MIRESFIVIFKPGNILLDGVANRWSAISDWPNGWSQPGDLTHTPTIFGTPGYLAPEQASGSTGKLKAEA